MTISDRLKGRLREKEWSTRQLQKAVHDLDPAPRGSSYASVYDYVEGKNPDPPLAFLRAAAIVLGVRLAWLVDRDGAPTRAGERAARVSQDAGSELEMMLRSEISDWPHLGPHARAAIADAWAELMAGEGPEDTEGEDSETAVTREQQVAHELGRALTQPLEALGLAKLVIPAELNTYMVLSSTALRMYARAHLKMMKSLKYYGPAAVEGLKDPFRLSGGYDPHVAATHDDLLEFFKDNVPISKERDDG